MLQHAKALYKLQKLPNGLRGRLTVAYMSSDFGNHAVAGLIGGLFRKHDRIAFELVALALKVHTHTYTQTHTYVLHSYTLHTSYIHT